MLGYNLSWDTKFYFKTINQPIRERYITLSVDKYKSRFMAITPTNFHLKNEK